MILIEGLKILFQVGCAALKTPVKWLIIIGISPIIINILRIIIYRLRQNPKRKGKIGEIEVKNELETLPKDEYVIINDVLLKYNNETTQVDHIVVSHYGIFVIESKNYQGLITGGANAKYWTENLGKNKYRFLNPTLQNYAHIMALKEKLPVYDNINIYSIIAFSNNCKLKIEETQNHIITNFNYLTDEILKLSQQKVLSNEQVMEIKEIIEKENIIDKDIRKEHIDRVKMK